MKIKSFAVNNFRGISGGLENNRILFDGTNVIFIFGQNNVGKSSFLKAYQAFHEDHVVQTDFNNTDSSDIEIEIEVYIDENDDKPLIDEKAPNKWKNMVANYVDKCNVMKLRKVFKRADWGKKADDFTWKVSANSFEKIGYGGVGLHQPFQTLMLKPLYIRAMPTESDVKVIVNEVLKEVAMNRLSDADNKKLKEAQNTITQLQEEAYRMEDIVKYKKDVNAHFGSMFDGLSIDIDDGTSRAKFTHDKIGKDFEVSFRDKNEKGNSYEQVGHGSIRMAIFLLMLMRDKLKGISQTRKSFLVLFEEPELFLHPVLTKKLRELIYDVSDTDTPFQILCASHSPQMIDVSKEHASLARMIKTGEDKTYIYQVRHEDLRNNEQDTLQKIKEKLYEILRFDPHLCESFYADEVLLVEGDTESIILRGYKQCFNPAKDVFVVNCHSITNIPFYQRFFSKFNIPYSVICDTDHKENGQENCTGWNLDCEQPTFTSRIQNSISQQFNKDSKNNKSRHFLVFNDTFEPHHKKLAEPFNYDGSGSGGKPEKANRYWNKIIENKDKPEFADIPIIKYAKTIMEVI